MPLAGYLSATARMDMWASVAAGSLGSLLGAYGWYWVGCRIGEQRLRAWIVRRGRWLAITPEDLDRASWWFRRNGLWAVFFCRLIPGVRTLISLPAGFSKLPLLKFLLPSILGTFFWTAFLTYGGYLLETNYAQVGDHLDTISWLVLGVIAVLYLRRQLKYRRAANLPEVTFFSTLLRRLNVFS